jgi:hypothetical protein
MFSSATHPPTRSTFQHDLPSSLTVRPRFPPTTFIFYLLFLRCGVIQFQLTMYWTQPNFMLALAVPQHTAENKRLRFASNTTLFSNLWTEISNLTLSRHAQVTSHSLTFTAPESLCPTQKRTTTLLCPSTSIELIRPKLRNGSGKCFVLRNG